VRLYRSSANLIYEGLHTGNDISLRGIQTALQPRSWISELFSFEVRLKLRDFG